ncbi:MAG: HIT domain-containing protein, partial [Gemmatimonadetes bacterium]|nr:HIT domain-containing protein [Gemmatimonadota bacterium]
MAGEIPANIVKRADDMVAFKDASPQAPTHLLVVPTTHVGSLNDVKDAAALGKLLAFARDVAKAEG